jgi:hypothetical protein
MTFVFSCFISYIAVELCRAQKPNVAKYTDVKIEFILKFCRMFVQMWNLHENEHCASDTFYVKSYIYVKPCMFLFHAFPSSS